MLQNTRNKVTKKQSKSRTRKGKKVHLFKIKIADSPVSDNKQNHLDSKNIQYTL